MSCTPKIEAINTADRKHSDIIYSYIVSTHQHGLRPSSERSLTPAAIGMDTAGHREAGPGASAAIPVTAEGFAVAAATSAARTTRPRHRRWRCHPAAAVGAPAVEAACRAAAAVKNVACPIAVLHHLSAQVRTTN